MEIKLAELMNLYAPAAEPETVSPERVRARTLARIGAALLAVGAAAAKQIGFDELPALLHHCFGIGGAAATGLR